MNRLFLLMNFTLILFSCKKEKSVYTAPERTFVFEEYPFYKKLNSDTSLVFQSEENSNHIITVSWDIISDKVFEECGVEVVESDCPYSMKETIKFYTEINWDGSINEGSIFFTLRLVQSNEYGDGYFNLTHFGSACSIDKYPSFEGINVTPSKGAAVKVSQYAPFDLEEDHWKIDMIKFSAREDSPSLTFEQHFGITQFSTTVEHYYSDGSMEQTVETFKPVY